MKKRQVGKIKIIEVPYDETKPMWEVHFTEREGIKVPEITSYLTRPAGRRELDDYKECGTYLTAGVPVETVSIESFDEKKPHEEQIRKISTEVVSGMKNGSCCVMTGGGCSHAIGLMGGLKKVLGQDAKIGFIWLDAHGDFNTPESTASGLVGGTPLATIAGLAKGGDYESWKEAAGLLTPVPCENIILTDVRDLDPEEKKNLDETRVHQLNTEAFNDENTWRAAVEELSSRVDYIYFHIDEDILDARFTPGQYTETDKGPDVETTMRNIRIVMETDKVCAFSLVSAFHENDNPSKELCTLNGMRLISAAFRSWKYSPEW